MADPYAKRKDESHAEWTFRRARMKADARVMAEPIVTPEAQRHGDYRRETVRDVDTQEAVATMVNRGGDAITRWIVQERLTEGQKAAIGHCTRLWMLAGLKTALTARYGERMAGGGNAEHRANNEIEARRDLHRIQDLFPKSYWDVFENVCRHGMPAGVAGSDISKANRNAKHAAFLTVCFVADVIAMKERL